MSTKDLFEIDKPAHPWEWHKNQKHIEMLFMKREVEKYFQVERKMNEIGWIILGVAIAFSLLVWWLNSNLW